MNKRDLLVISMMLTGINSVLLTRAPAGNLLVAVKDSTGSPVKDAVVYAKPVSSRGAEHPQKAVVSQKNKEFIPFVSAVQVGTPVQFPNLDPEKHHIYSLSPAKPFNLPLYSGTPANPIIFDKTGVVTLGCNIHDWMLAYICVVDTPWFAVTGTDGQVQLRDLPSGSYDVEVWQPRLKSSPGRPSQRVTVDAEKGGSSATFQLSLKPEFRLAKRPPDSREAYR
jgi:plastocyanin